MQLNTHLKIDQSCNGTVSKLREDYAKITLKTTSIMIVDDKGLIHGGFIFGAADFTAMAAVNHPFVVLAKSEVKFLAPVKEGEIVTFEGRVIEKEGNRATVEVVAMVEENSVFKGRFYTATLEKHVLS
jgi:acyl-coenzyme A thioesterase PaaI-like protein